MLSGETEPASEYRDKIIELIPKDIEVSNRCINICAETLETINESYGPNATQKQLKYHNAEHSLNVIRRSFDLSQALQEVFPEQIAPYDYELIILAASFHDLFQLEEDKGANERRSVKALQTAMFDADYSWDDINRASQAAIATTVSRDKADKIDQYMLHQGSDDIIKFVLATADINGIAMEGSLQMIQDATNLYVEISGDNDLKNVRGLAEFLSSQASFLRERLDCLDNDIAYYFANEDRIKAKQVMQDIFEPSQKALDFAVWMEDPLHQGPLQLFIEQCRGTGEAEVKKIGQKLLALLPKRS